MEYLPGRWTLSVVAFVGALALGTPSRSTHHEATVGSIDGVVKLHLRPPRRVAPRYPGAGAAPHPVQSLPAVAYLQGRIPGVPVKPETPTPTMMQHDTAFVPRALVIPVGTTVSFPNTDPFFHNVFSYSRTRRFDLGRYPKGVTKKVTFDKPGIVKVYCEVHHFMRAVIVVTENPFHAVVKPDGTFHIDGVPPGTYTLVIWHPDLGRVEKKVVVPERGVVHVEARLG